MYIEALRLYTAEQEPGGIARVSARIAILLHFSDRQEDAVALAAQARAAALASNDPAAVDEVE